MPGDARATQQRLLEAAAEEFAAYGIAGARIDRIAKSARSNKAQIYHYFGSKDNLFNTVFETHVRENVRLVTMDPENLPDYAGQLFDSYEQNRRLARLITWYRLERSDSKYLLESVVTNSREKVAAISKAQKAGHLPTRFTAADLLALIIAISAMWSTMTPEFWLALGRRSVTQRRRVVTDAVAALVES